ncbi:MAG TPA: hypothetical protein VFY48_10360 [Solirubrobacterales bacterium]|nr:hypothetical protein [Solirubrobacterales bacterium]
MKYAGREVGWRVSASLLLFTLGLAAIAVLVSIEHSGSSDTEPGEGSAHREGPEIDLRDQLAIFRSPAEKLPADIRRILRRPRHATDWYAAQRLPTQTWRVWAVPGKTVLCLLDQEHRYSAVGETCSPLATALSRGLLASFLWEHQDRTDRVVVGLVPNHVQKVVLKTRGYPDVIAPVRGNIYALEDRVPEPPERAQLIFGASVDQERGKKKGGP